MSTIDLHDSQLELDITFDNGARPFTDPQLENLVTALRRAFNALPLAEIRFLPTATAGVYTFDIEHSDARIWKQTIDFRGDEDDPMITFDVTPGWKPSEFLRNPEVQLNVIKARKTLQLESMTAVRG